MANQCKFVPNFILYSAQVCIQFGAQNPWIDDLHTKHHTNTWLSVGDNFQFTFQFSLLLLSMRILAFQDDYFREGGTKIYLKNLLRQRLSSLWFNFTKNSHNNRPQQLHTKVTNERPRRRKSSAYSAPLGINLVGGRRRRMLISAISVKTSQFPSSRRKPAREGGLSSRQSLFPFTEPFFTCARARESATRKQFAQ